MQISLEQFDSQPTGVVASLNEDYLFESTHSSLPITLLLDMPASFASSSSYVSTSLMC